MKIYLSTALLFLIACQNIHHEKRDEKNPSPDNALVDQHIDTSGFFRNCKDWVSSYQGYLQGLEKDKDSLGPFCFYENYEVNKSFEVIFVPKQKSDTTWKIYERGCDNNFEDFHVYGFKYQMRDPDKQKDVHAMNVYFPLNVSVYKRIKNDEWQYIGATMVHSLRELSLEQFNTIYGLHNNLAK